MNARSARRRYVVLTVLRWLPIGVYVPLNVLLMLQRGLPLGQIGLVLLPSSIVVVALELPTGGLADALGRRPVLVVAALTEATALVLYAVATTAAGFAVASGVSGVARALSSGPLQAWYVDAVRGHADEETVRRGLAAGGTAEAFSLGIGAAVTGLLPALLAGLPSTVTARIEPLALPFLVAAPLSLVNALAVALLLRGASTPRPATPRERLSNRPGPLRLAREGVRLAARDGGLRRLLLAALGVGIALSSFELLWQPRFVDLLGRPPDQAAAVLGPMLGAGFGAAAVGSALGPYLARWLGSVTRAAVAGTLVHAACLTLAGLIRSPLLAAGCFLLAYLANGWHWPLHHDLLHARVGPAHRTVLLSVSSLMLRGGGILASLVIVPLAGAAGVGAAWAVAGALLVLCGSWVLGIRTPAGQPPASRATGEAGGAAGGETDAQAEAASKAGSAR